MYSVLNCSKLYQKHETVLINCLIINCYVEICNYLNITPIFILFKRVCHATCLVCVIEIPHEYCSPSSRQFTRLCIGNYRHAIHHYSEMHIRRASQQQINMFYHAKQSLNTSSFGAIKQKPPIMPSDRILHQRFSSQPFHSNNFPLAHVKSTPFDVCGACMARIFGALAWICAKNITQLH